MPDALNPVEWYETTTDAVGGWFSDEEEQAAVETPGSAKADDADFEVCMPVRRGSSKDGIEVRELPGGRCVSLLHRGPYDTISRSYERVIAYASEKGLTFTRPCREVYVKGPGMIFKGNPSKYLTEIQMFVSD